MRTLIAATAALTLTSCSGAQNPIALAKPVASASSFQNAKLDFPMGTGKRVYWRNCGPVS